MNKKILIGSIIAVAILVLVSFTSVVGYNNVESNKILSPLFNIRSNRAIDKESYDFTTDYIGKGNTFLIPKRDSKTALIHKFIDIIQKMDNIDANEILQLIRNNPKIMKQNPTEEDSSTPSIAGTSFCGCPIITIGGEIGSCLLYLISMLISFIQDTLHLFTFYCC